MSKEKFKRSRILINKAFQLKFTLFVCSWIFGLSLVFPMLIYNIFEYFLAFLSQIAPQSISVMEINSVKNQVILLMIILEIVFTSITFVMSLFLSHRIAGPLFRFRKYLENAKTGPLISGIHFRKHDYFPEIATSYNEMIQSVKSRLSLQSEKLKQTQRQLQALCATCDTAPKKELEKITDSMQEIAKNLAEF